MVIHKLKAAERYDDTRLDFMNNFTYELGVDDLVQLGALQWVAPLNH